MAVTYQFLVQCAAKNGKFDAFSGKSTTLFCKKYLLWLTGTNKYPDQATEDHSLEYLLPGSVEELIGTAEPFDVVLSTPTRSLTYPFSFVNCSWKKRAFSELQQPSSEHPCVCPPFYLQLFQIISFVAQQDVLDYHFPLSQPSLSQDQVQPKMLLLQHQTSFWHLSQPNLPRGPEKSEGKAHMVKNRLKLQLQLLHPCNISHYSCINFAKLHSESRVVRHWPTISKRKSQRSLNLNAFSCIIFCKLTILTAFYCTIKETMPQMSLLGIRFAHIRKTTTILLTRLLHKPQCLGVVTAPKRSEGSLTFKLNCRVSRTLGWRRNLDLLLVLKSVTRIHAQVGFGCSGPMDGSADGRLCHRKNRRRRLFRTRSKISLLMPHQSSSNQSDSHA
ncbi:uncharacterized protein G2W53_006889 [Senna tora]|uniref:Uncharacterized protein n=1 Tax=Senna tora TaxID=362788 RepID=A0A834X5Z1_9FABA|nr:uncharacterized protein G2W53_006889 [Senna tora]